MLKKVLGSAATAALAATSLVLTTSSVADAQKVANTGPGQIIFDSGNLSIGSESFEAGSAEEQVVVGINVAGDGAFSVTSLSFPPIPPIDGPLGEVDVTISLLPGGNGTVNPYTGASTLNFSIRIDVDGTGLGGDCKVSPVNISASTGASGGVAYNSTTGRVTYADHTFSVPGASGCSTFPINVNNEINSQLGLPSASGNNHAVFSGGFTPVRAPAIVPTFTATPSVGEAPLAVAFNAAGTVSSLVPTYQWDFTNNGGSPDATGVTTSFTYTTPGTYTARLRVTDGVDAVETTRTITVLPQTPDVTVTKSGSVAIVHGDPGSYTLTVGSTGLVPANGATVVDTLPAGLAFVAASGTGWSCGAIGQEVTCSSGDVVSGGSSFPDITVDVVADGTVTGTVTNGATVTTPGEVRVADNADTADTNLVQPGIDLDIDKVHDLDDGLFAGERATYVISVGNDGTLPADAAVFVTDPLPDGVTFISASGGLDWVCSQLAGVVQCFTNNDVAPGDQLDDIRIRVSLDAVVSPLVNTAMVATAGDSNPANDTATDTGEVLGLAVDYQITKVHVGDLLVGGTSSYGIGVRNIGTTTGGGTVTVTDELPAGLTYVGAQGDGWTCGAVGQTVTCTHPGGVEAGDFLPGITLQVVADASAVGPITNTASVAGAGDANAMNDSDSDPGVVRLPAPDLTLTKSHVGNFTTQANGTYTLSVRNLSADRADGPTTVVDDLPAGLTFVGATGAGWSCGAVGQQVTCTYAGVIAGLATAPPITLTAFAPDGAPDIVVNNASVANAQDVGPGNDSASDPTRIDRRTAVDTVLEAQPIVLGLTMKGGVPKLTLLGAPHATLMTADGTPVAGKTVTFKPFNQQEVICTAVTNALGVARCTDGISVVLALSQLRYTADFYGDLDHKASHDEAALLLLGGLRLL